MPTMTQQQPNTEGIDLPTITALIQKTYGVAFDVVDQATYEAFVEEQSVDL